MSNNSQKTTSTKIDRSSSDYISSNNKTIIDFCKVHKQETKSKLKQCILSVSIGNYFENKEQKIA